MKLRVTDLDFLEKIFLPKNLEKWTKTGPKTRFFEFIEKFGHSFFLNLCYNGNLCYLLCFSINPIFGKIFVPEIQTKMFSANHIAVFLLNRISGTNQKNSLIFCVLTQIHIN